MTASTHTPTFPLSTLIRQDLNKLNQALDAAEEAEQQKAYHVKAATVALNAGDNVAATGHLDQVDAAGRRALESAAIAKDMHAHAGALLKNL